MNEPASVIAARQLAQEAREQRDRPRRRGRPPVRSIRPARVPGEAAAPGAPSSMIGP